MLPSFQRKPTRTVNWSRANRSSGSNGKRREWGEFTTPEHHLQLNDYKSLLYGLLKDITQSVSGLYYCEKSQSRGRIV